MSLTVWLDRGYSMAPKPGDARSRLALWLGRRLALRHPGVTLGPGCRLSPAARIHPREGRIRLGAGCQVAPGAVLQGNIIMGDHGSVQSYSVLVGGGTADDPAGLIRIGDGVRIAPHVMMIGSNHIFEDPDTPICRQGSRPAPITIGDDVWVAGRVSIMAGVTIGTGCVLAAGAVVTKDIPPYCVAAGVPARVIRSRRPQDRAP